MLTLHRLPLAVGRRLGHDGRGHGRVFRGGRGGASRVRDVSRSLAALSLAESPSDPSPVSSDYRPELEKLAKAREDKKTAYAQEQLDRLMKDMAVSPAAGAANPNLSSARSAAASKKSRGNVPGDDDDGIISRGRWREDDAPWGEDEDGRPQRDDAVLWGDDDDDVEIDRSEEPIGGMFGRGTSAGGAGSQMSNWPRPA